jgi:hypothetical protein
MLLSQTYKHDGGLFSFQLPSLWSRAIEDDGTQVFWDDAAGSGTLRVTSLTATKQASPEELPQLALLANRAPLQQREDGVAWCQYSQVGEENGHSTTIYWWEFANFIPPCFGRLALFSFTVYTHELNEQATASQIQQLQSLVENVRFGPLQSFELLSDESDA